MRNVLVYWCGLWALSFVLPLAAYEQITHQELSEKAAEASILKDANDILKELGLKGLRDLSQTFPNSNGDSRILLDVIKDGADFEDNNIRPLFHFFDPLHDEGLLFFTSPTWALEDKGKIHLLQNYSFSDARDHLYKALTLLDGGERKRFFGKAFESLGRVIHHVQDMAQPQHVRLDAHLNLDLTDEELPFEKRSRYEQYTKDNPSKLVPLYGLYPPVNAATDTNFLTTARNFWHTQNKKPVAGLGIAEFTNTNFLSAGTNFDTATYPSPKLGDATPWDDNANSLLEREGLTVPPECLPPNQPCVMTFYRSRVQDNYRSTASKDNDYTSTSSIFDQDLEVQNKRAFSLNRFNFDAAHEFLIPRAVAYGAGLIDYFFRGKLEAEDMTFTDAGITLKVKNAINSQKTPAWTNEILYTIGSEQQPSTLTIVYEYKDATSATKYGVSNTVSMISEPGGVNGIAPGQSSQNIYAFTLSVPAEAKEIKYRLVFRGRLGQEDGAVVVGEVEPISGFLVVPNYLPADGIAGQRAIFKQGGQWRLSEKKVLVAGNIDWKGWYVNGKPTKVLTWHGPKARYFPNPSGYGAPFTPNIFQNGELFSVAPRDVLGAALMKDVDGKEWLIAICQHFGSDVVYRRPNIKSDSPALYDPITEKDGWQEIGRFSSGPGWNIEIPWFFNGNGTEAQTMRRISTYIFDSSGRIIGSKYGGLDRAKMEIANGSAKRTNLKNYPEIRLTSSCQAEISRGECGSGYGYKAHIDETISKADGSYIVAVDYNDDIEILAVLSDSRTNRNVFDRLDVSNSSCLGTRTITTRSYSQSGQLDLSIGSYSIFLDKTEITNTWMSDVTAGGRPSSYSSIGNVDHRITQEKSELHYIDLRHSLSASKKTFVSTFMTGSFEGHTTDSILSVPVTVDTQNKITQGVKSDRENQIIYALSNPVTTTSIVSVGGAGIPSCKPGSQTITYVPDYREVLKILNGSWSVDSGQNLFVSQEYRDGAGIHYFNYLTGGEPKEILPGAVTNATYYPIKIIK